MQFMIDCLPIIHNQLLEFPRDQVVRVLDVGTGTGAGANLLATLYAGNFLGPKISVETIDIGGISLQEYAKNRFPLIRYMVGDAADLPTDSPYDLVLCSHTIEHIEDYKGFTCMLQRLARKSCVFYAPWNEQNRIPEHVVTLDSKFLREVGATQWEIIESPGWGNAAKLSKSRRRVFDSIFSFVNFLGLGRFTVSSFRPSQCVAYVVPGTAR